MLGSGDVVDIEDRYRLLLELMPDGVVVHQDGVVVYANASIGRLLGTTAARVVGRTVTDYIHPDSRAQLLDRIATLVVPGVPSEPTRVQLVREDGGLLTIESISVLTTWKDRPAMQAIMRDLTDHLVAESALRFQAALVTHVSNAIIATDSSGLVTSWNPAAEVIFGLSAAQALGRPVINLIGPDLDPAHVLVAGSLEASVRRHDDVTLAVRATATRLSDSDGYVLLCSDETAQRAAVVQLRYAAHHDALTGLPNRTLILEKLKTASETAGLTGRQVAVLVIDLDNFKLINDSLGHDVGDTALCMVAQRITGSIRESDVAARLGGDEFVVVAKVRNIDQAAKLAQRLLRDLAKPLTGRLRGLSLHASVGIVTTVPDETRGPADLIRDADAAMYQAKAQSQNKIEFFDDALRESLLRRVRLETDLRDALKRKSLWVAYQPIVDVMTGRWSKAEALVRWEHHELGQIPPLEFIPIAEQSDLIHTIGRFVLDTACRDVKIMRNRGVPELTVSVNLSARQLDDPGLVQLVEDTLRRHQLPPDALCLEVTESVLATDEAGATHVLDALRKLGVSLSIDDFGTGYSSLARLLTLPVNELKIDRSFISDMPTDPPSVLVVSGIIALAHALGIHVVAEGVETQEHLRRLQELGCDYVQGYYFAKPRPLDEYVIPVSGSDRVTVRS